MIHFDEPFLTIFWEEEDRIVRAQWKSEVRGEPMRRGLEVGLALLIEKRAQKWLVDSRFIEFIDPTDVKWVNDHWMPRGAAAGLRFMAFVMAKKVVMQMSMKSFIARINEREISSAYFDDLEPARDWLRAQH